MSRDSCGKCLASWKLDPDGSTKRWKCRNHIMSTAWFSETQTKCYYSTCTGRSDTGKPLSKSELEVIELKRSLEKEFSESVVASTSTPHCIVINCNKPIPAGRNSTLYCSENCRKNASRQRKKGLLPPLQSATPTPTQPEPPPPPPPAPTKLEAGECLCVGCSNKVVDTKYCSSYCRKKAFKQRTRGIFKQ